MIGNYDIIELAYFIIVIIIILRQDQGNLSRMTFMIEWLFIGIAEN
jgi:hypothetical protein